MRFSSKPLLSGLHIVLLFELVASVGCSLTRKHEEHYPDGTLKKAGELDLFGEQEGVWKHYYQDGSVWIEATYVDDNPEGPWIYWYDNGNKEMEGAFSRERRRGPWRYWHRNGSPRALGSFQDGRETGPWLFFAEDGQPERQGCFENGSLALRWTYWHPNGEKKAEGWFRNGVRVGLWRYWDESGNVSEKLYPLPDGVEPVIETWSDGRPRREGFLVNGRPDGLWVTWHPNSYPRLAGRYINGGPQEEWTAWRADGDPLAHGKVDTGRPIGTWRIWTGGVEGAWQAQGSLRPPGIQGADWSDPVIASKQPPEAVVETWLSELQTPIDPERTVELGSVTASPPPEGIEETVSARVEAPIGTPILTTKEEENLESLVEYYTEERPRTGGSGPYGGAPVSRDGDVERSDDIVGKPVPIKTFETPEGDVVELDRYKGKSNVLLVILRGYTDGVCVYCTTQTRALSPYLEDFRALGTEVVCVYPGPENGVDAFREIYRRTFRSEPPYSLLLDTDNQLARKLGLESNLAIPSTLLVDKQGIVRFAYVGTSVEDRPPVKELLAKVKEIEGKTE